jgi:signal transduction histidine kinase
MTEDITERFREEAASGGIPVELHAPAPLIGRWDRLRLEQVVTNLLSNALKFGDGKPISVRVSGDDSTAVLTVADRGIGIASEDLARIFHQFERVLGRRTIGGLGMGLYIVRQIVLAHGGRIDVESTRGEGSRFQVKLPRGAAS